MQARRYGFSLFFCARLIPLLCWAWAHSKGFFSAQVFSFQNSFYTETGSELRLSLSELADHAQTPAEIDAFLTRKRLRFHEAYLEALLQPAFERFAEKRRQFAEEARAGGAKAEANHQMLIIAMSNAHAAAILDFVRERFPEFVSDRIGRDVPARDRARALKRYREGAIDVMTQVDMSSNLFSGNAVLRAVQSRRKPLRRARFQRRGNC